MEEIGRYSLLDASKSRVAHPTSQQQEDDDLYDEVDEDQYKSIVRGRLQKDDFIVDDGVEGYADNGMDDWGHEQDNEESDEDVKRPKSECSTDSLLQNTKS